MKEAARKKSILEVRQMGSHNKFAFFGVTLPGWCSEPAMSNTNSVLCSCSKFADH